MQLEHMLRVGLRFRGHIRVCNGREQIGPISIHPPQETRSRLTLQRALVPAELPREVRVLAARLRVLRGDGALRPRIGPRLREHRPRVRLGGVGHVGVRERGAVPAEDAVVVLLHRR